MANRTGSVFTLVPGLEASLEKVPGTNHGSLLSVRGPNVMLGYYLFDNPGEIQPSNTELGPHWYNTGDIVEIDTVGFIFIKGRVERFAKVAGEMVSLEIVETIATQASPDYQHAATTQNDTQRGENIALYTTDNALTREQLSICAKTAGSPELAVARKIIVIAELPMLGTGETDYLTLKQMAENADTDLINQTAIENKT